MAKDTEARHVRQFVGLSSNRPTVQSALSEVLGSRPVISSDEKSSVRDGIRMRISLDALNNGPRWINSNGIVDLVSELTSSNLWEILMRSTPKKIKEEMSAEFKAKRMTGPMPEEFAGSNASFVTAAIISGLFGAVLGEDVKHIFQRQANLNTDFAKEIGKKYGKPPKDREEVMQRITELIPDPDSIHPQPGGISLFDYFVQYDAFTAKDDKKRCPATEFTQLLLEEWGRILHHHPEYRARFENTAFKRNLSVARDVIDFSTMSIPGLRLIAERGADPANRESALRELELHLTDDDVSTALHTLPGFSDSLVERINSQPGGQKLSGESIRFGMSYQRGTDTTGSYTLHVWDTDASGQRIGLNIVRMKPTDFAQLAFPGWGINRYRTQAKEVLLRVAKQAREKVEPPQMTLTELENLLQLAQSFTGSELISGHPLAKEQMPPKNQRKDIPVLIDGNMPEQPQIVNPVVAKARREVKDELIAQAEKELSRYPQHALRKEVKHAKARAEQKLVLLKSISELDMESSDVGNWHSYKLYGKIDGCPLTIDISTNKHDDRISLDEGKLGEIKFNENKALVVLNSFIPLFQEINGMVMTRLALETADSLS